MAGNIAKRANGKWRARYRDESGKEHSRHFDRKIDAQQWLDAVTHASESPAASWPKPQHTPRQMPSKSVVAKEHPQLWELYQDVRADFTELSEELGINDELILKPSLIRLTVWAALGTPMRHGADVAGHIATTADIPDFLADQDAREWQIELATPLLADALSGHHR